MNTGTFEKFCRMHKINLDQFPELESVLRSQYTRARAGCVVTDKTIAAAIQDFKRKQADEQSARSVNVAGIVQASFETKVMRL